MASEGREQKLREKVSVNHIAKPGRSQKKGEFQRPAGDVTPHCIGPT